MSNETMTDSRADQVFAAILGQAMQGTDARAAYENIAARLRGEAAQGEQQAVARPGDECSTCSGTGLASNGYDSCGTCVGAGKTYRRYEASRPHPVAVAGNAVRALRELRDEALRGSSADTLSGDHDAVKRMLRRIADRCDAALSAAPAAPTPVAGDAWCMAFVAGAKWWEWEKTGATMWQSDQQKAYEAAVKKAALAHDRASQGGAREG